MRSKLSAAAMLILLSGATIIFTTVIITALSRVISGLSQTISYSTTRFPN